MSNLLQLLGFAGAIICIAIFVGGLLFYQLVVIPNRKYDIKYNKTFRKFKTYLNFVGGLPFSIAPKAVVLSMHERVHKNFDLTEVTIALGFTPKKEPVLGVMYSDEQFHQKPLWEATYSEIFGVDINE